MEAFCSLQREISGCETGQKATGSDGFSGLQILAEEEMLTKSHQLLWRIAIEPPCSEPVYLPLHCQGKQ